MKLALDPQMFFATSSVFELPDVAASLGYAWIELSPKDDFIPFFRHPRIDDAGVRRLKKVAADAGVGIASIIPLASPCSGVLPLPKLPPLNPALSSSTVRAGAEKLCAA